MAKMFYSLEEAAERLGVSEDEIAQMAAEGKLQEFRDRKKRMFKRDQVDSLAGGDDSAAGVDPSDVDGNLELADDTADTGQLSMDEDNDGTGGLSLQDDVEDDDDPGVDSGNFELADDTMGGNDSGNFELADEEEDAGTSGDLELVDDGPGDGMQMSSDTDDGSLDLAEDAMEVGDEDEDPNKEDTRQATGISVFDADELDDIADPMSQTQVGGGGGDVDEEDLALESVGSGSGLLDLTRESDDTSLGAELLDEIYPGSDSDASGMGLNDGSGGGSAETFDPTTLEMSETSAGDFDGIPSSSGLDNFAEPEGEVPMSGSGLEGHSDFGDLEAAGVPGGGGGMATAGPTGGMMAAREVYDPSGNLLTIMMFLVATVALCMGMVIAFAAVFNMPTGLQSELAGNNFAAYFGAMAGAALVLGFIGFLIGKKFE